MAEDSKQEQQRPIILEIVAEDDHDADLVAIGEIGRGILDEVKRDGFTVEPVYTGQRGGVELLFEIVNYVQTTAQMVGTDIYAQRDVIGVVANLMTVFVGVSPLAMKIFKVQEKHPIKISIVIDGVPITVEAVNFKDAEAMLELAKEFYAKHPYVNATPQSQVKIQASVPKKARRGRR